MRAPRLSPAERIAPYITRRGRFRALDPRHPRSLPSFAQLAAVAGWVVLVEESLRRAWRAERPGQAEGEGLHLPPSAERG